MPTSLWSKEEIDLLHKEYTNHPNLKELLLEFPLRNISTLTKKASDLKIPRNRKYWGIPKTYTETNKNYFENINERNSYWAGFIAADGHVSAHQLSLTQSDKSVIEKFCKELNYFGKISSKLGGIAKKNPSYSVSIYENKLVNDIRINFNIVRRKTLILKPPKNLNHTQFLCYLAGYIDGDGCVRSTNEKYIDINIISTYKMLEWILNKFNFKYKISLCGSKNPKFLKEPYIQHKNPVYRTTICGSNAIYVAKQIRNIKQIDDLLLDRKWKFPLMDRLISYPMDM